MSKSFKNVKSTMAQPSYQSTEVNFHDHTSRGLFTAQVPLHLARLHKHSDPARIPCTFALNYYGHREGAGFRLDPTMFSPLKEYQWHTFFFLDY